MREIKYQGYQKHKHAMLTVRRIHLDADGAVWWSPNHNQNPIYNAEHYPLREYTGVKDKNGKEIYEGDVICLPGIDAPAEIVWNEKEACFACNWLRKETQRIRREAGMPHLPANLVTGGSGNPWEVIGNIYENLDLLDS